MDFKGVALAAIQGLNQKLEAALDVHARELKVKDAQIRELSQTVLALNAAVEKLTAVRSQSRD
jgi:hypothetical protein